VAVIYLHFYVAKQKISNNPEMGSPCALEFGDAHKNLNFEAHTRKLVTMTLARQERVELGKKCRLCSSLAIPQAPNGAKKGSPCTIKRGKG